ncbi:AAA family ATPase [Kitasatospora sp. NPDC018058]|uniref:helix-turn-helix transcriptional regulator n=1 Tax=Kitasatospora sp. NPDC018058 TaxID=3364025 RepID=UPI0037C17D40
MSARCEAGLEGRDVEQQMMAGVLGRAREGTSGVLVLRGPAGIGKTELLRSVVRQAPTDLMRLSCLGVQTEMGLPYAGLHQLLRPLLGRLGTLPAPQAAALAGAFGLADTEADRFLVALAALTLLTEATENHPMLLAVVDDAQFLDPASRDALRFLARRLEADRVAVLFGVREGCAEDFHAPELPVLRVGPLTDDDGRRVLARSGLPLAESTVNRLLREAAGNPLALTELPLSLTDAQRRGLEPLPEMMPLGERLQEAFLARVRRLPHPSQVFLLMAAVHAGGDLGTLDAAAQRLGLPPDACTAAERAGLVGLRDHTVEFRHPLIRAAACQAMTFADRQAVHRALAEVLTGQPERQVLHLAAATSGTDDELAAQLSAAAARASRAGGAATAVGALERAASLASRPEDRLRYMVEAAESAWRAAQAARANALLEEAGTLTADPGLLARINYLRGSIKHASNNPAAACRTLIEGAAPVMTDEPELAGTMLVMAARGAFVANDAETMARIGHLVADLALPREHPIRRLGRRLVALVDQDLRVPAPDAAAESTDPATLAWLDPVDPQPWVWPPTLYPYVTGVSGHTRQALEGAAGTLRERGQVGRLPMTLAPLVALEIAAGRWASALANGEEGLALAEETGQEGAACHLRVLLAWMAALRGQSERCRELVRQGLAGAAEHRIASAAAIAHWALGLLALGEGRPEDAVELLERVVLPNDAASHFMLAAAVLPDLVEASVRAGRQQAAEEHLCRYEQWRIGPEHRHFQALLDRCRALVRRGDGRDELFRRALDAPAQSPFELARSRLLYGEWLRRERRIKDARAQLQAALAQFRTLEAEHWVQRTKAELRAAGGADTAEPVGPTPFAGLTPREMQIVRYVGRGMSNQEIAAQLFLSPRTVGYHLYKLFPKLGVTSRHQLRGLSHSLDAD